MIPDEDKTKEQLINELEEMRQRIAELETSETECKRVEESIKIYQNMVESAQDAIFFKDLESRYIVVNDKTLEAFGLPREEVIGKNDYEITPTQEEAKKNIEDDQLVFKIGKVREVIKHTTGADGKEYLFHAIKVPQVDDKGSITGLVGIARDITERKLAEVALRESERFSSTLLSNSPNPILVINLDTSVRYVNPALEQLTGFSLAEVIGRKAPYPWWTEETQRKTSRDLKEAMRQGAKRLEELFQKKDGERFWVEITSTPVMRNEELVYYLASWIDITERKQVEEALRESEEKYRELYETAPIMLYTLDKKGVLLDCNKALLETFGRSREEMIGKPIYDFQAEESRNLAPGALEEVAREGTIQGERNIITKDGKVIAIEFDAYIEYDEERNETVIKSAAKDITERKQAEEALRQSEKKYRDLVENLNDAIYVVDENGVITYVSPVAESLSGYSPSELIGRSFNEFVCEEDLPNLAEGLRRGPSGQIETREHRFLTKSGEIRWVRHSSRPVFTENRFVGLQGVITDITERKQAEEKEKKLQQELYLSSRLAAIGELAAGVAHEINNPLTGIMGFSQRLLRKSTDQKLSQD